MTLQNHQYELSDGVNTVVFGRKTPYTVAEVQHGAADSENSDARNAASDGIRFGRDFKGGRTISFDMNILVSGHNDDEALNKLDTLGGIWRGDQVRSKPGATMTLRYKIAGRTRRVYGRPRNFEPTSGSATRGWIPVTCEFRCSDDRYYEDEPVSHTMQMVSEAKTGFAFKVDFPFSFGTDGVSNSAVVSIPGSVPSLPVFTLQGPVTNPVIRQVGGWRIKFLKTLASDEIITLDPRPWVRQATTNFGENVAGKLDADSPLMHNMVLEPGEHSIILEGDDPTATSSLTVECRPAHATY